MTSVERGRRLPRFARSLLLAVGVFVFGAAHGQVDADAPEVWLVTYGPGEIYWQRFGHNAIWIRDADLGLDHTFNFGFFDFEQQDFFLRFLQGRMLYFSAAQPASAEFAQYIDENRSIRAQRLALPADQALELAGFLVEQVQPANRDYLYDYYVDNCSTRVRDALDRALGGRLKTAYENTVAPLTFRDHTRRSTEMDFWLDLGLELVLGAPVDRPISRWDEFFIPALLAEGVTGLRRGDDEESPALVAEDVVIYSSDQRLPPSRPSVTWPRYLLAALAVLAGAAALVRWTQMFTGVRLARLWFGLGGLVGSAMVFFWVGTDHSVAADNLNLLLFSPLWLISLAGRRMRRPAAMLVWVCGAAALIAPFAPPYQYTADVLAAFLPLNLVAGWALWRT